VGAVKTPIENSLVVKDFLNWVKNYPATYKIMVAGNHDTSIERKYITKEDYKDSDVIYLEHETVEVAGYKIFGSPYTPTFGQGWAFNIDRSKLYNYWSNIEEGTDIIITHGPPLGILDKTERESRRYESCGDRALLNKVLEIQPKLHVFGHLHDEKDVLNHGVFINDYTTFINASMVDLRYEKLNKIITWDI
jgi:Icc-related predicted phosphoesterase